VLRLFFLGPRKKNNTRGKKGMSAEEISQVFILGTISRTEAETKTQAIDSDLAILVQGQFVFSVFALPQQIQTDIANLNDKHKNWIAGSYQRLFPQFLYKGSVLTGARMKANDFPISVIWMSDDEAGAGILAETLSGHSSSPSNQRLHFAKFEDAEFVADEDKLRVSRVYEDAKIRTDNIKKIGAGLMGATLFIALLEMGAATWKGLHEREKRRLRMLFHRVTSSFLPPHPHPPVMITQLSQPAQASQPRPNPVTPTSPRASPRRTPLAQKPPSRSRASSPRPGFGGFGSGFAPS
jgi:hypothetical protein